MTIDLRLLVGSAVLGLVHFEALAASLQKMSETVERNNRGLVAVTKNH